MKKILSLILISLLINTSVYAVEFDTSIDESIRKNYKVEENDLPELPKSIPTADIEEVPPLPAVSKATGKTYTLKSGSKVNLILRNKLSDWSPKGAYISFSSSNPVTTKEGYTIPSGTIFKGRVTDSHRPQITGNGGLIELCVDEIHLNGVMSKIDTKIALANSKRVFRSDIKGQRKFWKNCAKATKPGRKAFKATSGAAHDMASIPIINLLSPVIWIVGGVVYIVNAVFSPVVSVFCKGGSVSLPAGTQFQIKITDDVKIKA